MDSLQPYVYADIRVDEASGDLLDLVIENTGPTVATNVQIAFEPPLRSTLATGTVDLETPGVPATLSSLPPGRRMTWLLDSAMRLFEFEHADLPRSYKVRITADGPFGELQPLEYVLDVNDFINSQIRRTGTLAEVAKEIKHVATVMKSGPSRPPSQR
jgi:hypothetical protein